MNIAALLCSGPGWINVLLPRPACNDTAALITWDSEGGARRASCLSLGAFGVIQLVSRPHGRVEVLSAGEVNPDVRAGSCSAQQGNGLLRLQRVRADEPAETHGQTGRQAGRETDRSEGRGATACFGSLDPLRIEPSPLLFPPRTPTHLPPALDGGKAEHGGSAPRCFSRCLYG